MTCLMGLETEYAIAALQPREGARPDDLATRLLALARQRLRHLPCPSGGIFLENGARLYRDTGAHIEYSTPEATTPGECVAHAFAGDAILRDLVMEMREGDDRTADVVLLKTNVDYAHPGVSWASHDSHRSTRPITELAQPLIPHLVSRVWCGAGGLAPARAGIIFSLSPRLLGFRSVNCGGTLGDRPIFHAKNEPLANDGSWRLHVICGDSLCSQTALWLRLATTSLVVAMAGAEIGDLDAISIKSPVAALHDFCLDPGFSAQAEDTGGSRMSAIDIERRYLEAAERHIGHPALPEWAPEACSLWRAMLDRIEAWARCGRTGEPPPFDWAIKWRLFADHLEQRGVPLETLARWNKLVGTMVARAPAGADGKEPCSPLTAPTHTLGALDRDGRRDLARHARDLGLDVDLLLCARNELCEIDVRFGQLAPDGIFAQLEPCIAHRLDDVGSIDEARTTPPAGSRALLRGTWVARLAGTPNSTADWWCVVDREQHILDLSNPFECREHWRETPPASPMDEAPEVRATSAREELSLLYNRGDLIACTRLISRRLMDPMSLRGPADVQRYLAWVLARRGSHREALDALERTNQRDPEYAANVVALYRFRGTAPHGDEVLPWLVRAEAELRSEAGTARSALMNLLDHKGVILAARGNLAGAEEALREACTLAPLTGRQRRIEARAMVDLAEVRRRRGEPDEASSWLDRAEDAYREGDFEGERAEHLLMARARIEHDGTRRGRLLRTAAAVHWRFGNLPAAARVALIEARCARGRQVAERRRHLLGFIRDDVPDLQVCPVLERILGAWEAWACAGPPPLEGGDHFEGV